MSQIPTNIVGDYNVLNVKAKQNENVLFAIMTN